MFPFSQVWRFSFLWLLPLGVAVYYGGKLLFFPARPLPATGPLVALLVLGQLPILHVVRLALPGPEANGLGALLLGGSAYVLYRLLPLLARVAAPAAWRFLLLGLVALDGWVMTRIIATPRPPAALPGWVGDLSWSLGVVALVSLLAWAHRAAGARAEPPRPPSSPLPAGHRTIAEARQAYYRQAKALTPGLVEYLRWFHTLPAAARPAARLAGPQGAWTDRQLRRSFRLFVLEHRGHRYVDFMAEHLDAEQFMRWVNLLQLAAPDGAPLANALRR